VGQAAKLSGWRPTHAMSYCETAWAFPLTSGCVPSLPASCVSASVEPLDVKPCLRSLPCGARTGEATQRFVGSQ